MVLLKHWLLLDAVLSASLWRQRVHSNAIHYCPGCATPPPLPSVASWVIGGWVSSRTSKQIPSPSPSWQPETDVSGLLVAPGPL